MAHLTAFQAGRIEFVCDSSNLSEHHGSICRPSTVSHCQSESIHYVQLMAVRAMSVINYETPFSTVLVVYRINVHHVKCCKNAGQISLHLGQLYNAVYRTFIYT